MPKYKRGTGSVYLRGRIWWLSYYVDGKHILESAKTRDKKVARDLLKSKVGQAVEGTLVVGADRVTWKELAAQVIRNYKVNARRSLNDLERRIEKHLTPFFGKYKAHEVRTPTIEAYILKRKEEKASNGTINRELAALKRMYRIGVQSDVITRMPYVPMLSEDNVRKGFFEQADFERLLAELPSWLRGPTTFAYLTGWRFRSEVLPLEWSNIDLERKAVRLNPGSTKNKEGRLLYMQDDLEGLLRQLWNERSVVTPESAYVFHRNGKRLRCPYAAWRSATKRAGLQGKIIHDFRRTAVRNMIRAGVPETVAMQMSGHLTRAIFTRYAIVADRDLRDAAERLSKASRLRTATVLATVAGETDRAVTVTH